MTTDSHFVNNEEFWKNLDLLISKYGITIDRPKGTRHPKFIQFVYPYDYGFIPFTKSSDGEALDVWVGNSHHKKITGILNITDMDKFDAEMKVLYACTESEMAHIFEINNQISMSAILIKRRPANKASLQQSH